MGVDFWIVVLIKEFLVGRSQRVRVDGQLSVEVRESSGEPQGIILSPLLFLIYVNDIRRNTESNIGCSQLIVYNTEKRTEVTLIIYRRT